MRSQFRKYVPGVFLVALLSITVPAIAATADSNPGDSTFSQIISAIVNFLEVAELKGGAPPG
jgi:hypothetical protein